MRLTRADLEAFDPGGRPGTTEKRWLCPLCHGDRPRDGAHRCLAVEVGTGKWTCFRCHEGGILGEHLPERRDPRAKPARVGRRRGSILGPSVEAPLRQPRGPSARRGPEVRAGVTGREVLAALHDVAPLVGTPGAAYLAGRGIPLEVAHGSGVRWSPSYHGAGAVLFPVRALDGLLVAVQGRRIDNRARPKAITVGPKSTGVFAAVGVPAAASGAASGGRVRFGPGGVLNADTGAVGAWKAEPVVLVEGPIDALSLAVAGYPALALMGGDMHQWLGWACGGRRVLVASDGDEAGELAASSWSQILGSRGAHVARLRPPDGRDWNDLLREDGAEALGRYVSERIATAWPVRLSSIPEIGGMTLDEFRDSRRWSRVDAALLGEQIVIAADNVPAADLPPGVVVYRARELARLDGAAPDVVRLAHDVKRIFGGEIEAPPGV